MAENKKPQPQPGRRDLSEPPRPFRESVIPGKSIDVGTGIGNRQDVTDTHKAPIPQPDPKKGG